MDGLQMLARGAFSIDLQQTTVSALSQGRFPSKTPNDPDRWNWVHAQLRIPKRRRPMEVIVPDMAGEALLEEANHPHSYRVVRSMLSKCVGVMMLIDATSLNEGSAEQDYFSMKLLSHLIEQDDKPKGGWTRRPVALVFTKADECEECFHDADAHARAHATGLWRMCQERFRNHQFFASGVAGACAYRNLAEGRVRVPLRIEPRGIIEPFEWLVHQLKK
jgi:hypothetical protein